jgi:diguanylate cyclase (GGDEF)-like protein/PAS domain S-box-containing protein
MEGRSVPDALLSSLTELQDAVFVKDLEGRYLLINDRATILLGIDRSEILGRTDEEFLPAEVAGALREHDVEALRTGDQVVAEEPMVIEGEPGTVLTTKAPLRNAAGEVVGVIGVATDISARKRAEEELRQREAQLAEAQELTNVGSWVWKFRENERFWSRQLYRMFGIDSATPALEFEEFLKLVHPDDRELVVTTLDRGLETGEHVQIEFRVVRSDDEVRVIACCARFELDLDGTPLRSIGACQDITERAREEELLRAREAQLNAAQELTGVGSWEWRLDTDEVVWSDNLYRIFGIDPKEFQGTYAAYLDAVHPDDRERRHAEVQRVIETGQPLRAEHRIVRPDGGVRTIEATASLDVDGHGHKRLIGAVQDVTELRRAERELTRRALADPLTGLGNRTLAFDRLAHALEVASRRGSMVAVLYLDIDGFKEINDELGHAAGDEVLLEVARRLKTAVRESDTLARIGGDEFLVVCEDVERVEDVREIAERVRRCFGDEFEVGGGRRRLGISVGTAFALDRRVGVDQLVGEADAAMYRAKGER